MSEYIASTRAGNTTHRTATEAQKYAKEWLKNFNWDEESVETYLVYAYASSSIGNSYWMYSVCRKLDHRGEKIIATKKVYGFLRNVIGELGR